MRQCESGLHFYEGKQCKACQKIWYDTYGREYHKKWREQNRTLVRETCKKSKTKNSAKRKVTEKIWRQNNKAKRCALQMKRQASKLQRTPPWLTPAQLKEIEQFYIDRDYLTYYTGTKFEVDHIIPLQGKIVSGLHVPWNLQLLTEAENVSKGNRI